LTVIRMLTGWGGMQPRRFPPMNVIESCEWIILSARDAVQLFGALFQNTDDGGIKLGS
jgi:hypothetical protein